MKRLVSIILSLTMLISASATVNAAYGEHEHQLMDMANLVCHYSECTICFELFNVGDHTFENGKCTVCGHYEPINPFADVASDAWYTEDVLYAVETGLINGKTKDEFRPDDNLTYAEAVKLAACMNQLYTSGDITLANGEPWYQPYADYCKENKIIRTDYNWNDNATRVGYMYIFSCALPDEAYEEINNIPEDSIPDVPSSAPYADPIYKLYRAGIVTGVDADHNCNPTASIKRSEVAVIVARMMNADKRIRFDLPEKSFAPENPEITEKIPTQTVMPETEAPEVSVAPENPEVTNKVPTQEVTPDITVLPTVPVDIEKPVINSELTIHKQPEGAEYDAYGKKHELEVQVFGGKAPYTYEWYYKDRRDNVTITNGDYVKDAGTEALVLSVEKENTLLGASIYCKITDSLGASVTTDAVKVYGPFSMVVEAYSVNTANKEYTVVGRAADGVIRKGERISVIRNGKVIAIGTVKDIQMFEKSLDKAVKGDNAGIVFEKQDGATPGTSDTVVKYQPDHKVDTSDIVN